MNIDTLSLALIATELNNYYKHFVSNALRFYCQLSLYAMKLTGCCTSVSLVFHIYVSAAHCEHYRILFHIKMRDIVQTKLIAVYWGLLCTGILFTINNILTNTITPRSNLKRIVIDGSHSDIPLC